MKRVLFTMLMATFCVTGCADVDSAGALADDETVGMTDGETSEGDEGGSETSGDTEGSTSEGETGTSGDGDGDGDGGMEHIPVEPYQPCDPMEAQDYGSGYCADGPGNINDPDSPVVEYTCVFSNVAPAPGEDPSAFNCVPLQDHKQDGTSYGHGCKTPGGGELQFAGCLNLACISSDQLPVDHCFADNPVHTTNEGWDDECCTSFCNVDSDCEAGLKCMPFGGIGACMEG
jgi:hypothetical protein